jgi:hypothetical protein
MIDENVNCMSITQSAAYVDKIVPEHNMVVACARHAKVFTNRIFGRQAMRNRSFFTRMSHRPQLRRCLDPARGQIFIQARCAPVGGGHQSGCAHA